MPKTENLGPAFLCIRGGRYSWEVFGGYIGPHEALWLTMCDMYDPVLAMRMPVGRLDVIETAMRAAAGSFPANLFDNACLRTV